MQVDAHDHRCFEQKIKNHHTVSQHVINREDYFIVLARLNISTGFSRDFYYAV